MNPAFQDICHQFRANPANFPMSLHKIRKNSVRSCFILSLSGFKFARLNYYFKEINPAHSTRNAPTTATLLATWTTANTYTIL